MAYLRRLTATAIPRSLPRILPIYHRYFHCYSHRLQSTPRRVPTSNSACVLYLGISFCSVHNSLIYWFLSSCLGLKDGLLEKWFKMKQGLIEEYKAVGRMAWCL